MKIIFVGPVAEMSERHPKQHEYVSGAGFGGRAVAHGSQAQTTGGAEDPAVLARAGMAVEIFVIPALAASAPGAD